MTVRTFWTFFIKILGIFLILDGYSIISQSLAIVSITGFVDLGELFGVFIAVLVLLCYFILIRATLLKTDWIIDKLHLDKGFDQEKFNLQISLTTMLRIAVIIIGGLILIRSIPDLGRHIILWMQSKHESTKYSNLNWIVYLLIKGSLGFLLLKNSRWVVKTISRYSSSLMEQTKDQSNEN